MIIQPFHSSPGAAGGLERAAGSFWKLARLAVLAAGLSFLPKAAMAQTAFYVDPARTANGSGTAASPWQNWSCINWASVSNALGNGNVTIYFSSRATQAYTADLTPQVNGLSANQMIQFVGDAFYNTAATGTAVWQPETNGNRVVFTGALSGTNYCGGTILLNPNTYYVSFKGIHVYKPVWGCCVISSVNPTTNVHDIYITNCFFDSPIYQHGIFGGYLETNCYNFAVSGCVISNTLYEPIYFGHYCYFPQTITNVIIESNLIVNCGVGGYEQGQVNLKPGVYGAIFRYNTCIDTVSIGGGSMGVGVLGDCDQIYGNTIMNQRMGTNGEWGYGIMINDFGDWGDAPANPGPGQGPPAPGQGVTITSCLVYNNILANCGASGIMIYATVPNASISGVRIWNNLIWGNTSSGIMTSATSPDTVTIAELKNNIIGNNGSYDLNFPNVILSSCDYNMYWRASGSSWYYNGSYALPSFAAWQALGFDLHGTNAAPVFVDGSDPNPFLLNFRLRSNSPGRGMGVLSGFFMTDMFHVLRPNSGWDLGPIQYVYLPPPSNLHLVNP